MSFVDSIKSVFTHYVDFNGRARRSEYWWFMLFQAIVDTVLMILSNASNIFGYLTGVWNVAILLPVLALQVRRLHDIGKKGIWILIGLIPIVGEIILFIWSLLDSEPGANEYGENPKDM